MKNVLLILFVILCFQSTNFAQEEAAKFRLELTTQSIFTQGNVYVDSYGFKYKIAEKLFNYSAQISAFWHLGDRMELGAGLAYANRDVFIGNPCSFCRRPAAGDFFLLPYSPGNSIYTEIQNIEVPLEMRWNWRKQKHRIKPYTSLGLNNHFPINYYAGQFGDKTRLDVSEFYMGLTLGVGIRIYLSEKWSLNGSVFGEKNRNFKFEKNSNNPNGINRYLDEWSVKFGVSRDF